MDLTACNYVGHLKNDSSSAAAVTGCLNDPEDVMDVTLISSNNINKMFTIDIDGNTKVVENPFGAGSKYFFAIFEVTSLGCSIIS